MDEDWTKDLRLAILNEATRSGKISLLTMVPLSWSIRQMKKEFYVSRRMASRAKKLHASSGCGARPQPKRGRRLKDLTVEKIRDFFCLMKLVD